MNRRLAVLLVLLCPAWVSAQSSKPGDERWDFRFGLPGVYGTVLAATSWQGKLCVGGGFHVAGTSVAEGVALWNGRDWEPMGDGLSSDDPYGFEVYALANWRGTLYAGGNFIRSGANSLRGIARWDGANWVTVGGLSGVVRALVPAGDGLYIAGSLRLPPDTVPADTNYYGLVRWNGLAWQTFGSVIPPLNNSYPPSSPWPVVELVVPNGSEIFISGDFETLAGLPIKYNARWTGTNWESMGITSGVLSAMTMHQGQLYASAYFPWTGNPEATNIARWDGTNWWPVGAGLGYSCGSLISDGANLYAAGSFTNSGNVLLDKVAKWNGSEWQPMGASVWTGNEGPERLGRDLEGNLYALGGFTRVQAQPAGGVAKWNQSSWEPVGPAYALGLHRPLSLVYCMATNNGGLIVGGFFNNAGTNLAGGIAILETNHWNALGAGIDGGTSFRVRAITVWGGNIIAGGSFTSAGGSPATNLACWDGEHWSPFAGGVTSTVYSLATFTNQVIVGGGFTQIGGSNLSFLAAWNGTNWNAPGGGVDAPVTALGVSEGRLYAGGRFTNAGGLLVNQVAAWDGAAWHALGTGLGATKAVFVYAFAGEGTNLYVGGYFQTAGGIPANNVARWNGTTWSSLGEGAENGVAGRVYALAVRQGRVYVGGSFTNAGSVPALGLAMWNGTNWSGLGSGIDYPGALNPSMPRVFALAMDEHSLYVGGVFLSAGNKCSAAIARWIDDPALTLQPPIPTPYQSFLLPLHGTLGLRFEVEHSTDLRHWLSSGTFFGLDDQMTVGPPSPPPQTFYRCRLTP